MGIEDTAKKGLCLVTPLLVITKFLVGFLFTSRSTYKNRSTVFTLSTRDSVLTTELEDPIIVIPQAQKAEKKVQSTN